MYLNGEGAIAIDGEYYETTGDVPSNSVGLSNIWRKKDEEAIVTSGPEIGG
jgi:hypothetical protein